MVIPWLVLPAFLSHDDLCHRQMNHSCMGAELIDVSRLLMGIDSKSLMTNKFPVNAF